MKAITIINPYAELIARGIKRVENRTWRTSYRGPLAIHAGKALRYNGVLVSEIAEEYEIPFGDLAFGAVVAIADLIDCVSLIDKQHLPRWAMQKYPWMITDAHTSGPECFILDNVRPLPKPIPARGGQMLWDWTPSPAAQQVLASTGLRTAGVV